MYTQYMYTISYTPPFTHCHFDVEIQESQEKINGAERNTSSSNSNNSSNSDNSNNI